MAHGAGTRRILHADAVTPKSTSHTPLTFEPADFVGKRVHLIGIGGCGMSAAARVLLRRGAIVTGSDASASMTTTALAKAGAIISIGQSEDNVPPDADLVVYSAAIKSNNPEMQAATRNGHESIKYAGLLGRLMKGRDGIAIAGTHGKSTTTAMTAFVLKQANCDPSFVIGATVDQLGGGSGVGDGPHFVVEACEYDRSFLNLAPRYAAILNIEEDHLDYYRDLNEICDAFADFARLVPSDGMVIVNGENRNAVSVVEKAGVPFETFGFGEECAWQAVRPRVERGCFRFEIARLGKTLTSARLRIPGRHNVANALATCAVCWHGGVPVEQSSEILADFRGVGRRLTRMGHVNDITVLDDYAHHPTEIQVTLKAARELYQPRKLWVIFQPHQHSRTRFLLGDFARSFALADVVLVPDIYFVRDSEAERSRVAARDLVDQIHLNSGDARYEPDFGKIVHMLRENVQPGDAVITMGAGDVHRIATDLVNELLATRPGIEHGPKQNLHLVRELRDAG